MRSALRPDWITDPALPARHGFFTRRGGVSSGVFEGLNCGGGSSDQRDIVALNPRRRRPAPWAWSPRR